MNYYERPLRPDELMHFKYIDKIKIPNGWRYIYEQAGGKYKKQAASSRESAKRHGISSSYNLAKAYKKFDESTIYENSSNAHSRAAKNTKLSYEQRQTSDTKAQRHYNQYKKAEKKGFDYARKAEIEQDRRYKDLENAKSAENKYKNSLAYKYDYQITSPNSTLSKVKKQVNKGKNFFKKLFG